LSNRDEPTRTAIKELGGSAATEQLLAIWDDSLAATPWTGTDLWAHCDLMPGNLIIQNGRLVGVIDFDIMNVGDPAADLMVAWNLLDEPGRHAFREGLRPDPSQWRRGRGHALASAVAALPYYRDTNPGFAEVARYTIRQLLNEGGPVWRVTQ